ncbi:MAG: shikimate dehydrogenase [Solirubrobacteraceae bacterium]|jgi:shikimate dehydrogenase|nr:shikimate dehydrogenase [Solirubrobacteraceae bacterium]
MHEAAFAALGLEGWTYQRLPVPPELFEETTRALPAAGFVGANVTIPHKQAALAMAGTASPAARSIGAANTLSFAPGGEIEADNTDGPGFLAALPEPATGRTALVLGAGGSARAVVWALREAEAKEVMIWNRTPARAQALARDLGARVVDAAHPADLLVNCTSVGLADSAPPTLKIGPVAADEIRGYRCVIDLVYGSTETALVSTARGLGLSVVDGLEILVRQGALSFERWTGQAAPLDAMRHGARGR